MSRRIALSLSAAAIGAGLAILLWPRPTAPVIETTPGLKHLWTFSAPRAGSSIAAPWVDAASVHFAVVHARGFRLEGAVYTLDPATGKLKWFFDADDSMLPTASSPVVDRGRLYFGEGMHANFSCRFFCLDAQSGKPLWSFKTGDHIEGGPLVAGTNVVFPSGNDGLYALDVATGDRRWNFRAGLHIDSMPVLHGDRLYVGSGRSRKYESSEVVCLDAANGQAIWRTPVRWPAWASPAVFEDRVYAGLGNGRLTEKALPPETPAGAIACLHAATGEVLWSFPVGDAVFAQPVASTHGILFGSRDGSIYAISPEGKERYRLSLGGPVMASLTPTGDSVIAVSVPGRIVSLDPQSGAEYWRHQLDGGGGQVVAYARPRIRDNRLFVAYEVRTAASEVGVASISCFELPTGKVGDQ